MSCHRLPIHNVYVLWRCGENRLSITCYHWNFNDICVLSLVEIWWEIMSESLVITWYQPVCMCNILFIMKIWYTLQSLDIFTWYQHTCMCGLLFSVQCGIYLAVRLFSFNLGVRSCFFCALYCIVNLNDFIVRIVTPRKIMEHWIYVCVVTIWISKNFVVWNGIRVESLGRSLPGVCEGGAIWFLWGCQRSCWGRYYGRHSGGCR